MMSLTSDEWVYVTFMLILAFVVGFLMRGGGGKWKRELADERAAHAKLKADYDARVTAANARIAELERNSPPNTLAGGTIAAAASGKRDDLALIRGVGRDGEDRLNALGIHGYRDIEKLTPADEAALEGSLGYAPGRIAEEHWREQAHMLRTGKTEELQARYG
jgi:predicted flap endonuclease-1-like 5' DNA nuclease